ncbi:MAG TPA: KpsF/GutQ family sugar-phosphate isomerase, partial [Alphaproteobacteria bacterium]|nr:KpsF/GutQ family sugar-phosphate isomerase [Alphaproteobacteria bacterium]
MTSNEHAIAAGRRVIEMERDALDTLAGAIDGAFADVVAMASGLKGRLICAGIGKSGHVARKIAATLASTGTPAYFVHP